MPTGEGSRAAAAGGAVEGIAKVTAAADKRAKQAQRARGGIAR